MSEHLHFAEHTLQEVALGIMALVYTIRLLWLFRFTAGKERQGKTGLPFTTKRKGILYSWGIVAMPWSMESSRKNFLMWLQFVIFHLGVVAAIGLSFIIPYGPGLLETSMLVSIIQVLCAAAFIVGVLRFFRRVSNIYVRAISTPDDFFSILLLTVWFAFAFLSAPNDASKGEGVLLTYFIMTGFFLIYVPFSKIGHYLYYPITRYYFGKSMGNRGTYPLVKSVKPVASQAETEALADKVTESI